MTRKQRSNTLNETRGVGMLRSAEHFSDNSRRAEPLSAEKKKKRQVWRAKDGHFR